MYFQENSEMLGSVRYISDIIFIQLIKSDDKLFKNIYIVKQQQQQQQW